ncbi:MAG TPA: alpha/beta hydrolase [Galbitalea sp.]|jgi:acetyl esterase|nr:alpha/beta hydrolase [Galbitalea sp.]
MSGNEATTHDGATADAGAPMPSEEVRRYFADNPGDDTDGVSDIAVLREQTREVGLRVRGELEPIGASTDGVIGGVHVRRYQPLELRRPAAVFLWIHGGGWMHGDLDVYEEVCRAFANALGCEVISVDYGLAPEHPFPFAFNEIWAVTQEVAAEFPDVVLAGDSSGANLAAAVAIKARDEGARIAVQLLIYPVLESSDATEFKQRFRTRYSPFVDQADFGEATHDRIKWIWDVYVPDAELRESPFATPMRAQTLRGVAPAVIVTAEHDILRGEGEAYAAKLRADGVPVNLLNFAGQIHGFLQMRGVLSDAGTALESAARAVSSHLTHEPARSNQESTQHRQRSHNVSH